MEYVEILRGRRVLSWYVLILLGMCAITVVSVFAGNGHVSISSGGGTEKISSIVQACAFGAWIVTTCMASGLNLEGSTIPITWTRPISRDMVAWRFVAVDAATIVVAYAFLFALIMAFFAIFGALKQLTLDSGIPVAFALGLGTALMWYGLITLVTSRMSGRGALIAGLSWAAFLLIGGVWAAPLPPIIHGMITALNYLNPIAYFGGISSGGHGTTHHVI
jgi:hypothetical protein